MIGRPRRRHVARSNGSSIKESNVKHTNSSSVFSQGVRQNIWLKRVLVGLTSLVILGVLWVLVGTLITYSKVTESNSTGRAPLLSFLGDIRPDQLQGEGDGRINILLIGIGGKNHQGGLLADTIMVASLDSKNKELALLSLPRDLYVPIAGNGYAKINSAHSYGEQFAQKTGGGAAVMKKTVSNLLDLPIHYYMRVDFEAFIKIIDTVGGVTMNVERPIVDLSYPASNMIDYEPFRLKAGIQTLDGKVALKYARSRHSSGAEGSDFARARRQQLLIAAVKTKAFRVGVLANPRKINEFMRIVGDHVKTDITIQEAERFFQYFKEVDESKIISKVIDNGPGGPLVSHSGDARGSILLPKSGDFSEVQQIVHEIFVDPFLRQEKATISLVNASGSKTVGLNVLQQLKSYGYIAADNTPPSQAKQKSVELINKSGEKPYTVKFLESRFKTSAVTRREKNSIYDLILIIGSDYTPTIVKSSVASPSVPKTITTVTKENESETVNTN